MADELSTVPGFGWANLQWDSSNKVVLDQSGFAFSVDEASNKALLSVLLKSDTGSAVYDACMAKLREGVTAEEFDELMRTGKSCGRHLKVDVMSLAPNVSFSLHAHPQVEVISVLSGEIFEYRLDDDAVPAESAPGLDLRASAERAATVHLSDRSSRFRLQSAAAGEYIVNRPGSVHLSFTRAEPTVLLVFWSGEHWKLPAVDFDMPPEVLPL